MEIENEQVVTDAEAKEIINSLAKDKELKYEQKNAAEVLEKFVTMSSEDAKKLYAELLKIAKLKDRHIVTIINIMPKDKDDLRAVLHKDYATFTEDEINLILETLKKFG
jgi:DNA-directed RNA polymerase subunit F